MRARARIAMLAMVTALAAVGCAAGTKGGLVVVPGPGPTLLNAPVKSLVELRYKNVVRQAYDLSCGAAALATILNNYYDDPVSERTIIDATLEIGDREKILKDGFSLLELKRFAEREGYVSAGYRLPTVEDLARLKVPAITLVNVRGFAHFVVIKRVHNGQVFIADPAFGNRSRSLASFDKEWNKVVLVVLSAQQSGNTAFMDDGTLRSRPGEVLLLVDRALQSIPPSPGEFGLK